MVDLDVYFHVHRRITALDLPKVWALMLIEHLTLHEEPVFEADRVLELLAQGQHLVRILGWTFFSGYRFTVSKDVLIPRFDSEALVEAVILNPEDVVIDWCTGTGCIGLSLALRKNVKVYLIDKFLPPCQNAQVNVSQLKLTHRVQVLQADCFEPWPFDLADVIVANPPYIDAKDGCLQSLVNDPLTALVADQKGLAFYERLLKVAGSRLKVGGRMYLEIGFKQAAPVLQLAKKNGWLVEAVIQDLGARDRVIVVENRGR